MKEFLAEKIKNAGSDYIDAIYEESRTMSISFNKLDVHNVSTSVLNGGRITALVNGGYAGASFTKPDHIDIAVQKAVRGANALSAFDSTNTLLPAPVVTDTVVPAMTKDPRNVSFDEKVAMAREYLKVGLDTPNIFTVHGRYNETVTRKTFVNSEGTRIVQDVIICYFSSRMVAQRNSTTESIGATIGFDADFGKLQNRHDYFENRAQIAVDLLDAEPIPPGVHTIVADQDLSGVFTHEAFGHLSEADDTINNKSLQEILVIGNRIGGSNLNIIDQGDLEGASGSYIYDDQGVRATKTYLIKDGKLHGRLHSRLSAAQLDGELTGNYRATDYRFMPLVRMSNIFIDNGNTSFEELLSNAEDGFYLCGAKGGQTMGDLFTFGAQFGYQIKDGKLGKMVKDINISGNVFETLGNIHKIGNDFAISEGGGCGKTRAGLFDMQMLDKSGTAGPSVLIKNVIIGG